MAVQYVVVTGQGGEEGVRKMVIAHTDGGKTNLNQNQVLAEER